MFVSLARVRPRLGQAGAAGVIDRVAFSPLLVLQTDNDPRVRDGYISLGMRGHARALLTQLKAPICRNNVIEDARPCTPVPPGNLHGKEEVEAHFVSFALSAIALISGSL
jgi:hypothetical protein